MKTQPKMTPKSQNGSYLGMRTRTIKALFIDSTTMTKAIQFLQVTVACFLLGLVGFTYWQFYPWRHLPPGHPWSGITFVLLAIGILLPTLHNRNKAFRWLGLAFCCTAVFSGNMWVSSAETSAKLLLEKSDAPQTQTEQK